MPKARTYGEQPSRGRAGMVCAGMLANYKFGKREAHGWRQVKLALYARSVRSGANFPPSLSATMWFAQAAVTASSYQPT